MFNFIRSLFSSQSVDSIIADITQKIEHLHAVAELHNAEAAAHAEIVAKAQAAKQFAETEFARAKAIAGRLTALVNG